MSLHSLKSARNLNYGDHPLIVKFRKELLKRGTAGIKGIGLYFKTIDSDNNKKIDLDEFKNGVFYHNINMERHEVTELFKLFDLDRNGTLDFNEFLISIRPPLNRTRMNLISRAFEKLDKTRDGKVTVEDLRGVYSVKYHPKYQSGEWSEDQCLAQFLDKFEVGQHKDGIVTFEEFVQYYAGVSASIDSDVYFDIMMRQSWKL